MAFGEETVPWTYGIFGGRAYRFYALEREDEIEAYFNDLSRWKKSKV